jgi:hypothetical protein
MASQSASPIRLFYSYSHKDEDLRLKLETHLSTLRRGGLIAEWHDRKLEPGDAWEDEIDRHLMSADIVLLLVSADFIASDYCWGEEMTKALERDRRGEARVIPVILRHCDWQSTPLTRLQAVPKGGKPIKAWSDEDEAFLDVVAAIRRAVQTVRERAEAERRPKEEVLQRADEEARKPAQEEARRKAEAAERRRLNDANKKAAAMYRVITIAGPEPKPPFSVVVGDELVVTDDTNLFSALQQMTRLACIRRGSRVRVLDANGKLVMHDRMRRVSQVDPDPGKDPGNIPVDLSQPINEETLRAYTKWKYPHLPVDERVQSLLLRDLDKHRYRVVADLDRVVNAASDAVLRDKSQRPQMYDTGTDYLTKSLGFVDEQFRMQHRFAPETREAFRRWWHLVRSSG